MKSFRVILDVIALQLHELIEAEFAQSLSFSAVFPARPREVLIRIVSCI